VEIRYTDHQVAVTNFIGAFGPGAGTDIGKSAAPIVIPHLRFLTNDAWPVVRGIADNNGFPMLLMTQYAKGRLYVLTIPENFTDLYLMPAETLNALRSYVLGNLPVRIEGPAKISVFAYDNGTLIVESFRDDFAEVTVLATSSGSLTDLVSGHKLIGAARKPRHPAEPATTAFTMTLPPHSYRVFDVGNSMK
ncbi:MAG TPA: hypothetical protein VIH91_02165, partial [Terriglobales bacterium]